MKQKEMREMEIYYCDVCGVECGLPYYGHDDNGYGNCCSTAMHRAGRYLDAVNKLRRNIGMKEIEESFANLKKIVKKEAIV